jgi:thymidylate kinase
MVIGIEGPVLAGKTTLIRSLTSLDPKRFHEIQEYVAYAEGAEKFPYFPPANRKEALLSLGFFTDLEERRHTDRVKNDTKVIELFDRTIFTLAAFEHAARLRSGVDIAQEAIEMLFQHREWWPNHIILIKLAPVEIMRRQSLTTHKRGALFIDQEFNERFIAFLEGIPERFGVKTSVVDGNQSKASLLSSVVDIANI